MAQLAPERKDIYRGNKLFSAGELDNAIVEYRKALQKDSTSYSANYNLANTSYTAAATEESANGKVAKYEEAAKYLDKVLETDPTFEAWFNKGNVLMQQENYQQAVDAYKEALLLNPGDMDAKRNYIYARQKAQQQQDQQQNQQNQNNDQNQDQNQNNDQQNQDQNKDQNQQDNNQGQQNNQDQNNDQNKDQNKDQNDNKRDQDNKNNDDQNQDQNKDQDRDNNKNNQDPNQDQNQEGNSQPQQGKMDPRQAEQLLQAIADKEKKTQEKVREAEAAKAASTRSDKNW